MKIPLSVIITGLICITIIECMALMNGIDGILVTTTIAIIAGVIGVSIPSSKLEIITKRFKKDK